MNIDPSHLRSDELPGENAAVLASLEQQQAETIQKSIASGLLLPEKDLCQRLGWTGEALCAALQRNEIFTVCDFSGNPFYPAFFCGDKKNTPKMLAKVCRALGNLPGTSKWYFFTARRISLAGCTPLQALAKGHIEAVMNAAASYADGY